MLQRNVITAIESQKRRGDRKSVFVDGEFVIGAHEEVIAALHLSVGQLFDSERLVELIRAETARKARESALRLLSYRDRSKTELQKRLIGDDFPEDIVEELVNQLSEVGMLDDQKFSRDWVKSRTASKPMGKARLAWELKGKGVDPNTVDKALEDLDSGKEYELAYSLAARKAEKLGSGDPTFRNRITGFLKRRGFNWDIIGKVLDNLCPKDEGL